MSGYSLTQPACAACYGERYPGREAHRIVEPQREPERCVWCGRSTVSGIYVRVDPAHVPHPTREAES